MRCLTHQKQARASQATPTETAKAAPLRQRAHAHDHGPTDRAALFDNLIARIEEEPT